MRTYRGVKIYQIGEADWVFAKNKWEAFKYAVDRMGLDANEVFNMVQENFTEITQKEFQNGRALTTNKYGDMSNKTSSYKKMLDRRLDRGELSGLFVTTRF